VWGPANRPPSFNLTRPAGGGLLEQGPSALGWPEDQARSCLLRFADQGQIEPAAPSDASQFKRAAANPAIKGAQRRWLPRSGDQSWWPRVSGHHPASRPASFSLARLAPSPQRGRCAGGFAPTGPHPQASGRTTPTCGPVKAVEYRPPRLPPPPAGNPTDWAASDQQPGWRGWWLQPLGTASIGNHQTGVPKAGWAEHAQAGGASEGPEFKKRQSTHGPHRGHALNPGGFEPTAQGAERGPSRWPSSPAGRHQPPGCSAITSTVHRRPARANPRACSTQPIWTHFPVSASRMGLARPAE